MALLESSQKWKLLGGWIALLVGQCTSHSRSCIVVLNRAANIYLFGLNNVILQTAATNHEMFMMVQVAEHAVALSHDHPVR